MNPAIILLVKSYMPQIKAQIGNLEKGMMAYINQQELKENETHCTAFLEIDNDSQTIYIVIGAFSNRLFVRSIEVKPMTDFLNEMITKIF